MRMVRLYTGDGGESHFEGDDVPAENTAGGGHISGAIDGERCVSIFVPVDRGRSLG